MDTIKTMQTMTLARAIDLINEQERRIAELEAAAQAAGVEAGYAENVVAFLNHLEDVLDDANFKKIDAKLWAELVKPMRHYGQPTTPSEGVAAPVEQVTSEPVAWKLTTIAPEGRKPLVFLIANKDEATYAHSLWEGSVLTPLCPLSPAQPSADQVAPEAAVRDVLAERRRQIEVEGWTPEHDDMHRGGQMAQAAACYALHTELVGNVGDYLRFWPWSPGWWKPRDNRRNLVKAGALILAEIERIDRTTASSEKGADRG